MKNEKYRLAKRQALIDRALELVKSAKADLDEADAWVYDSSSEIIQVEIDNIEKMIRALGGKDET